MHLHLRAGDRFDRRDLSAVEVGKTRAGTHAWQRFRGCVEVGLAQLRVDVDFPYACSDGPADVAVREPRRTVQRDRDVDAVSHRVKDGPVQ